MYKILPLIIDEVQRAPEFFSPVKWVVDQSEEGDRIVLTGSQTYQLMKVPSIIFRKFADA